jgi:hypothetical protein
MVQPANYKKPAAEINQHIQIIRRRGFGSKRLLFQPPREFRVIAAENCFFGERERSPRSDFSERSVVLFAILRTE